MRDQAGRFGIADRAHRQHAGIGPFAFSLAQGLQQFVVGQARGDRHDRRAVQVVLGIGPCVTQADTSVREGLDRVRRHRHDAQGVHALLDVAVVQRIDRPGGDGVFRRDMEDFAPLGAQFFRDHAAEIESVVVVDDHRPCRRARGEFARHHIVRREDGVPVEPGNGRAMAATDAVAAPMATRRDHDLFRTEGQHVVGAERTLAIDLHVVHLLQLADTPVAHARPFGQAGQSRFARHAAAEFATGFRQMHLVAALSQGARRFQSGRTGADHQHALIGDFRRDALRMPALAPLLAHRRVLRAANRRDRHVASHADVTADAFADVVVAALLDLARQEGIGDRGARRTDHVEHAATDLRHHAVGRGEAADADDGFARRLLDPVDERLLRAFAGETRGDRIVVPGSDVHVPQVGQFAERVHDVLGFRQGDAARAQQFVDGETHGHRAGIAHRILGVLDHLAQQSHAVLERAAVFVATMVTALLQEMHRQTEIVRGVDVDDVETRAFGAQGRVAMPAPVFGDIAFVHRPRLVRIPVLARLVRRRQQHFARIEVGRGRSVVRQLHRGERAVCMHLLAHQGERGNVVVVP